MVWFNFVALFLVLLSCCFGLSSWLDLLAWHPCRVYSFHPWNSPFGRAQTPALVKNWSSQFFRCHSLALRAYFFKRRKSSQKVAFAANLPFGLLRNFQHYLQLQGPRRSHIHVRCALRAIHGAPACCWSNFENELEDSGKGNCNCNWMR